MKAFNIINIRSADWRYLMVVFFFLILPLAASGADFNSMLAALQTNMQSVIFLITAVGYVLGFLMVISAIMDLKKIGQTQGMSSTEGTLGGPLLRMTLGIALIYLPSTIDIAASTLGEDIILTYTPAVSDVFTPARRGALLLVQAIGYVAFIRGFVTLGNSTKPGAQQGSVGKGIMYIIGGILAINIITTIRIVGNTVGLTLLQ